MRNAEADLKSFYNIVAARLLRQRKSATCAGQTKFPAKDAEKTCDVAGARHLKEQAGSQSRLLVMWRGATRRRQDVPQVCAKKWGVRATFLDKI